MHARLCDLDRLNVGLAVYRCRLQLPNRSLPSPTQKKQTKQNKDDHSDDHIVILFSPMRARSVINRDSGAHSADHK